MEIQLSPEDLKFRDELREWLDTNLPAEWAETPLRQRLPNPEDRFNFLRQWQRKLYDGGWVAIGWPQQYGGRGASLIQQVLYAEEMARRKAPGIINVLGVMMLGPTLMQFGTEEQKRRYLPGILSADEIWCQGYSEPNAGSDLASLQTRAVEDGDDFVINGQKIWTTYAQYSDYCFVLVRTDPEAPKHKGISYVLVDMHSPGVTVRPLIQITGDQEFNETFFDNVRVPKANIVGEKNKGWIVAVTTLAFERSGLAGTVRYEQQLDELIELAHKTRRNGGTAWDDPAIRQSIAQRRIEIKVLGEIGNQILATQLKGGIPGPEASINKLFGTELEQKLAQLGVDILGPYSTLISGPYAPLSGEPAYDLLFSRAVTIYGGTSEIQRNIIGERGLGLPKG